MRHVPRAAGFALLIVQLFAASAPADAAEHLAPFVIENARVREIAFSNDGVLRISKTGGWIRTRGIVSDFVLTTEFKLGSPDTQAEVGIRAVNIPGEWPQRGYRIDLSARAAPGELRAQSIPITKVRGDNAPPLTIGEWHTLTVSAMGSVVTVTLGGDVIGVYEIQTHSGSLLFSAREGTIEFRNIGVKSAPGAVPHIREFKNRKDFQNPKLVREVKPNYSRGAMARKVQGVVKFEAVILTDGSVGSVVLTGPLDPELEHQGLWALQQWKFAPARLNGETLPVVVDVELTFTLRRSR